MPFCPKCRAEYVEGITTCDDCGVALTAEPPALERKAGDRALVEVWYTHGEMDAQLMRSLLESSGVNSMFSGESLRLTHGFTVDGLAKVRILVREEDAKRACEIISSLDGMRQCPECGRPAHEKDAACHYCKKQLS